MLHVYIISYGIPKATDEIITEELLHVAYRGPYHIYEIGTGVRNALHFARSCKLLDLKLVCLL